MESFSRREAPWSPPFSQEAPGGFRGSFRCFKAEQRAVVVDEAREPEQMGKVECHFKSRQKWSSFFRFSLIKGAFVAQNLLRARRRALRM